METGIKTVSVCLSRLGTNREIDEFFSRYLAYSYLSEALIYADKLTEAIDNININIDILAESDISFELKQAIDSDKQAKCKS